MENAGSKIINYTELLTEAFRKNPLWKDLTDTTTSIFRRLINDPISKLSRVRYGHVINKSDLITINVGPSTVVRKVTIDSQVWIELFSKENNYSFLVLNDEMISWLGFSPNEGTVVKFASQESVLSVIKSESYYGKYYGSLTVNSTGEVLLANLDNLSPYSRGSDYLVNQIVETALGLATITRIYTYTDDKQFSDNHDPNTIYSQSGTRPSEIYVSGMMEGFGTVKIKLNNMQERYYLIKECEQLGFTTISENYDTWEYEKIKRYIGQYYQEGGTKHFIEFVGFILNAKINIVQMWSNTDPDQDYVNFSELGNNTAVWDGGTWYPTSHVRLRYDFLQYPDLDVQQDGLLYKLFYQFAPIHLVLDGIDVETYSEASMKIGCWGNPNLSIVWGDCAV